MEITPRVLTLTEFQKMYKVSKYNTTQLLKDPNFPAVKVGEKRVYIPIDRLEAWFASQPTVGEAQMAQA